MAQISVPESFVGKSLADLRNERSDPFRADLVAGLLGIGERSPFTAGQTFNVDLSDRGSAENIFLQSAFTSGAGTPAAAPQQSQNLIAGQKEEEQAFLSRFRAAVEGLEPVTAISERLGGELGLPGLRKAAFDLGQTLQNIPGQEAQVARGVGISAPRLERRIAQRQGEIAPSALRATEAAQFGEAELGRRLGLETAQQERGLVPFQLESEQISDRLAREVSLFTFDRQEQLSRDLAELSRGTQLDLAKLGDIAAAARAEEEFERQKQLISLSTDENIRQSLALRQDSADSQPGFLTSPPTQLQELRPTSTFQPANQSVAPNQSFLSAAELFKSRFN